MLLRTHRGTRVETKGVVWKWQAQRATEAAASFEAYNRAETVKEGFDPTRQCLVVERYRCVRSGTGIIVELVRE